MPAMVAAMASERHTLLPSPTYATVRPATTPQACRRVGLLREVEDGGELGRGEVVDLEAVAGHASTLARTSTASSTSSAVTSRGGARRRAPSVPALGTRPASRQRAATPLAVPGAVSS